MFYYTIEILILYNFVLLFKHMNFTVYNSSIFVIIRINFYIYKHAYKYP